MSHKFTKTERDFKGQHLCDTCWNGHHFLGKPGARVCQCELGMCDCPCSQMEADHRETLARSRNAKRLVKEAQQALPDVGGIEV